MQVTPNGAYQPATLRITVDVEPEADHRYVVVQADSDDFSRKQT